MTDNEIIKALECCANETGSCLGCPLINCIEDCLQIKSKNALDLINCQKAEIERLQMDNKQLQSDVINANQNWDHIKGLWECEKEKVESAKQKVICACKMLNTVKSEAYKECLARVKNYIKTHFDPYGKPDFTYDTSIKILNFIDNLVNEMTEGN